MFKVNISKFEPIRCNTQRKKKINFVCPFELKTCENCHFWFWQLKRNSATPVSKKLLIFCLHSTFSRSFLDVDVGFLAKVDYPHENTRILLYTLLFYSFHLCIRITSVIFFYLVDSILLYFRLLKFHGRILSPLKDVIFLAKTVDRSTYVQSISIKLLHDQLSMLFPAIS